MFVGDVPWQPKAQEGGFSVTDCSATGSSLANPECGLRHQPLIFGFSHLGPTHMYSNHLRLHVGDGSGRVGPDAGARWLPGSLATKKVVRLHRAPNARYRVEGGREKTTELHKEAAEDEDDDPAASISCWLDSEWVRRDPHPPLLLQEAAVHDPSCSNSPASLLFP
ncbi:hypothetical protein BHE74_00031103 [Ensete ventricosum]|nr:hypothetical protein BHE74_00031103 [Ensete ventricosum]